MRAICLAGLLAIALGSGWSVAARAQAQAPAPPARQLKLTFNQGKVTLIASQVTVREIMTEWAKLCGCYVEGAEKLTGGVLMPMQFEDDPESVVLGSLLRGAGGYLLGPRAPGSPGASVYGRVAIFAVSHGTTPSYMPSSSPVAAPLVSGGSPDDEIPPVTPVANPQTPAQTSGQRPGGPAVPIIPAGPGTSTTTGPGTTSTTGTGRGRGLR
jgi:hypothetical protein